MKITLDSPTEVAEVTEATKIAKIDEEMRFLHELAGKLSTVMLLVGTMSEGRQSDPEIARTIQSLDKMRALIQERRSSLAQAHLRIRKPRKNLGNTVERCFQRLGTRSNAAFLFLASDLQ